jgi:putative membrane protein
MSRDVPSTPQPPRSANRVRDHLANERTFLAWVRTALGLIGLGFVLARMGLFLRQLAMAGVTPEHRGLRAGREFVIGGVVFLLIGTALCAWSSRLYRQNCRAIDAENYEPATKTALALAAVVVTGGLIVVGLVLWRTLADD